MSEEEFAEYISDSDEGSTENYWKELSLHENPDFTKRMFPKDSNYMTLTAPGVLEELFLEVKSFAEPLCTSPEVALLILRHFQWSKQLALERYFDDMEGTLKQLQISHQHATADFRCKEESGVCSICFDSVAPGELVGHVECSHWLCKDCLGAHLEDTICQHDVMDARCPFHSCHSLVGLPTFREHLPSIKYRDLERGLLKGFIALNPCIAECKNPRGCDKYIMVRSSSLTILDVRCSSCSHAFCFRCSGAPHAPATCKNVADWDSKGRAESVTKDYLASASKMCPKCSAVIVKNLGCNHMTCAAPCRHEFCWVCLGDWSSHGAEYYVCNKPKGNEEGKKEERKAAQARHEIYMHYYQRWSNHMRSLRLEEKEKKNFQREIERRVANKELSENDIFALERASSTLTECRRTLADSYIYAFYLTDTNEKKIFLYRQGRLEKATEELSEIYTGANTRNRAEILNASAIAQKHYKLLREGL